MAPIHGKGAAVLVDGDDLTSYLNQFSTSRGVDTSLTTTFGKDDQTYIAGLESGTISLGGYFDGETDAIHDALGSHFGADNSPILSVFPQGYDTLGNSVAMLAGKMTSYDIASAISDTVAISAGAQADGGLRNGGELIHVLAAQTTTFDGTSVDSGASSAYGGAGHLHVTAFTGTDVNIILQDSADDAIWADLIDWSGTAATGGYRSTVTGTVNRYLRARITGGTFSTVTFALGFARNKR